MKTRGGKVIIRKPDSTDSTEDEAESQGHHTDSSLSRVPAFLTKTWELASEEAHSETVSWSEDGLSLVIHLPAEFSRDLLPLYFKHSNLASFVRQLNTYGFQKSSPDRWEFSHPNFRADRPDLLTQVPRKRTHKQPGGHSRKQAQQEAPALKTLAAELDVLKRDREVIVKEVFSLRRQQQAHKQETEQLTSRLDKTEKIHQQLLKVLSSAVQDPAIQHALVSRPSLQLTAPEQPGSKRKRQEAEPGNQLVPFRSATSELARVLLSRASQDTHEAGGQSVPSPVPSPAPAQAKAPAQSRPGQAGPSGSQERKFPLPTSFVPMSSAGGVEAMPAISPFTSAADFSFDRPQVSEAPAASAPAPEPAQQAPQAFELSTGDILVDTPNTSGIWGLGPGGGQSSAWQPFDVLGSQPSWAMPTMDRDARVH